MPGECNYRHTQRAPLSLLLYLTAGGMLAAAVAMQAEDMARLVVGGVGVLMALAASSFHYLRVEDEGDVLAIRFGPLPLFAKTIRYDEMSSVEMGRTTWLDGWGIHKSLRGGWVWNLWGFDCVVIQHGSTTRVGTDDAERLADFLRRRIEA